jgi:hypothetical protein
MTLRIGFDMDGVLADFESAFHQIERDLFGSSQEIEPRAPEDEEERQSGDSAIAARAEKDARDSERRCRLVWRHIRATEDFWTTLRPTDPGAVRRLHTLALQHRWEVLFITQRPATAGATVQRQTQHWLTRQGFDMPSVLVIGGSRGGAANALRLGYHVDDSARHCLDVRSDSPAKPILLVRAGDEMTARQAHKLGICVAYSIGECLDLLERASAARHQPGLLRRLVGGIGWR